MKRLSYNLLMLFILGWGHTLLASPTYNIDIKPILERHCFICHSKTNLAFAFEDIADEEEYFPMIVSAVSSKRMPPWLPSREGQRFRFDYSLSDKQIKTFEDWASNGFEIGPAIESDLIEKTTNNEFINDLVLEVLPDNEYTPKLSSKDDYQCFVVDWPIKEEVFVTGFKANPGNLSLAHHLVVYTVEPEQSTKLRDIALDSKNNYECYGGPQPSKLKNTSIIERAFRWVRRDLSNIFSNTHWLAHWAPGMHGYKFPEGTGVKIRPGSLLIIQMHYYSGLSNNKVDRNTSISFSLEKKVEKPAFIYRMTDEEWLESESNKSMIIPPGKTATFRVKKDFQSVVSSLANKLRIEADVIHDVTLHSTNIHMHSFGASAKSTLVMQDKSETLLSIPKWIEGWQRDFEFQFPKIIKSDDFAKSYLSVSCSYSNPTTKRIYGGWERYDEMCFHFSYISASIE